MKTLVFLLVVLAVVGALIVISNRRNKNPVQPAAAPSDPAPDDSPYGNGVKK